MTCDRYSTGTPQDSWNHDAGPEPEQLCTHDLGQVQSLHHKIADLPEMHQQSTGMTTPAFEFNGQRGRSCNVRDNANVQPFLLEQRPLQIGTDLAHEQTSCVAS